MSGGPGAANLATACALVDELARRGVRYVVVAPGSRSTPLTVAVAAHPAIRTWMHVDERSAAFFALGIARASRNAVAIVCTSGTAAANFLPAVVEAKYSRVSLVVLTADRPPELRDWGAAQTIDQIALYGSHVKWFVDMPLPEENPALQRHARATVRRAVETASSAPWGPVHLNVPFREPLLPADLDPAQPLAHLYREGRPAEAVTGVAGRDGGTSTVLDDDALAAIAEVMANHERGVIVCGPGDDDELPGVVAALSAVSGYPVLADPLSGVRYGDHPRENIIDAYDAFLRDVETAQQLAPDLILRTGGLPAAKTLQTFIAANPGREHILFDRGDPRDPGQVATAHLRLEPAPALSRLTEILRERGPDAESSWLQNWQETNAATRLAIDTYLASCEEPFEGRAAAEIADLLPDGATLVVGNSMPVRDVDTFVGGDQRCVRVVGNRGASGIDGLVSSALGAAAVAAGPVVLLVGDLSFYHDLNGLLAAKLHGIDCTIVVINNDGGGIFSFLPQADLLPCADFERLFGTPTGLDFHHAAALYGATFNRPTGWPAFREAVAAGIAGRGLSIVELVTGRERNVTLHREVWRDVAAALRDLRRGPEDHA
ncbi:MAG: 2-succinyl-5-enolpyruvyl-6-hydroxy-3-cyclohexene-1-carboxylic-acid synthase [Thermomicrobiales bacterium]